MSFLSRLKKLFPSLDLKTSEQDLAYAKIDQSTNVKPQKPLAVAKVANTDELKALVFFCLEQNQPLVIRAAGTGKSGGAVAANEHCLVIDISKLNKIIKIDDKNLTATVEPGVVLGVLQKEVKKYGLFYPPDPASWQTCTIGGNVAENAAGPSTLKYGSTKNYLLGGELIIGTKEIFNFGKSSPKGVSGYDLASVLCGSEGTLGVLTKIILRLLPYPKDQSAALFLFKSEEEALASVSTLLCRGHLPKTLEFIDETCLKALNKLGHLKDFTGLSALIIECDSSFLGGALGQINAIKNDLQAFVCDSRLALNDAERENLWLIRSLLSEACSKYLGYKISEDIALPLSKLKDFAKWFKTKEQKPHLLAGLFGHTGDGNLHVQIMFDEKSLEPAAQALRHEILLKVLELSGTLTAEHGIGLQKKAYFALEHAKASIDLQKRIKEAFDPHNLLNPGKIFN